MFEVVDLVACAAFRDDEITASDVNVLFSTLLVFSSICFMPAYIKRQKPQFFRDTNKRSNQCLHRSAESRLFGVVMSQWTLSTVTGDAYKVHLNTHLRAEVFVQIRCLIPRHLVKITPSSCSHENFINMLCFLKWQCNWNICICVGPGKHIKTQPGALQLTNEFVTGRCFWAFALKYVLFWGKNAWTE